MHVERYTHAYRYMHIYMHTQNDIKLELLYSLCYIYFINLVLAG